jgi:hypothetical protein
VVIKVTKCNASIVDLVCIKWAESSGIVRGKNSGESE